MNDQELDAYGELATVLSSFIFAMLEVDAEGGDIAGPYFYCAMSDYADCAEALWQLKILRPIGQDSGWSDYFQFDCTLPDAYHVALRNASIGPSFEHLLEVYVEWRSQMGSPGLGVARNVSFTVRPEEQGLFADLCALGYVTESEKCFTWTEKVAPLMEKLYLW